jgi:hypothetical protein
VIPDIFQPRTDDTIQGTGPNVAFCGFKAVVGYGALGKQSRGQLRRETNLIPVGEKVPVKNRNGSAVVEIRDLPPSEVLVLTNRAKMHLRGPRCSVGLR